MNNIVITNSAEFAEVIQALEQSYNKILEIFDNERKNAEKINATDTWTGNCQKVVYEKYKMLNNNYGPIEYSLDLYIKFLKKTLEDYTLMEQEINKNLDNMESSLNVNS